MSTREIAKVGLGLTQAEVRITFSLADMAASDKRYILHNLLQTSGIMAKLSRAALQELDAAFNEAWQETVE